MACLFSLITFWFVDVFVIAHTVWLGYCVWVWSLFLVCTNFQPHGANALPTQFIFSKSLRSPSPSIRWENVQETSRFTGQNLFKTNGPWPQASSPAWGHDVEVVAMHQRDHWCWVAKGISSQVTLSHTEGEPGGGWGGTAVCLSFLEWHKTLITHFYPFFALQFVPVHVRFQLCMSGSNSVDPLQIVVSIPCILLLSPLLLLLIPNSIGLGVSISRSGSGATFFAERKNQNGALKPWNPGTCCWVAKLGEYHTCP